MVKHLYLGLFLIALVATATSPFWLGAADDPRVMRPLDLPSGGVGEEEEDEDATEVITFYGESFEGDGFFWVLDKSGSMEWNDAISILKSETTQSISQLSVTSEFSVCYFSSQTVMWSHLPKPADPGNKAAALNFVETQQAGGGTCLQNAAISMLNVANQCKKGHRTMIIVCDGQPNCGGFDTSGEALVNITAGNYQRIPIDCICITSDEGAIRFMQDLAAANSGKFHLIINGN